MADQPNPTTVALEQTIASLEQRLVEMRAAQISATRFYVIGAGCMLLMIGVFAISLVSAVRDNLRAEEVQKALTNEFEEMKPELDKKMNQIIYEVGPVYKDAAMAKFQAIRPQLEARLKTESQNLQEHVKTQLDGQVAKSLTNISNALHDKVKERFPTVSPQQLDALSSKITADFSDQSSKLQEELKALYVAELTKVQAVLIKFPIETYDKTSKLDLEKLLVRRLLALVDHEIEVSGTPEGMDVSQILPATALETPATPAAPAK